MKNLSGINFSMDLFESTY